MDFRIQRSAVEGKIDDAFFWAIIEPVWPDATVTDELEHIAKATIGQRSIYVATLFVRLVNNGGLESFLMNSSGLYGEEVRKALSLLKAEEQASAFEEVANLFPGGRIPEDQDERERFLKSIPRVLRKEILDHLNNRLFGEERLWPYFRQSIDQHSDEFFID